jgi:restriction system protein
MAWRRRDNNLVEPITQLAGLGVLAFMSIPDIRQALFSIGIIALALLGIVAFGLIVFGLYRLATPERNMHVFTRNVLAPPLRVPEQKCDGAKSEPERPTEPLSTTELIEQLRSMDWFQFEKLVGHVYQRLGYTVTRRGGANPDGGIDLVIQKDGLSAAVQCKQWKAWRVGVKVVREFLGALTHADIPKGIFITLRGYTGQAMQFARKNDIEIVNEVGLAQMLESTNAGLDPEVLGLLRDARKFCPQCERELVIRVAETGPNPGSRFWGCSGYPSCHFTMPLTEDATTPAEPAAQARPV